VRILIATARFPEAHGKGDQSRLFSFMRHLSARHALRIITPSEPSGLAAQAALAELATVEVVKTSLAKRLVAAMRCVLSGEPLQVGWMMPDKAWQSVQLAAHWADVVLVNTVRSIRGRLGVPMVVDHVDALSLNMQRRAECDEWLALRWAALIEAQLLVTWERRVARWSSAQVATAEEDSRRLIQRPPIHVIPVGWDEPPGVSPINRDIDVVVTGNMGYPPNRDGARWFANEIVPLIRVRVPDLRAWVVGRGAASLGLSGVTVASDVAEMSDYLRRAKVAVAPLRWGTGTPYKVVEAAANGAAVVATPWVAERFALPIPETPTAETIAAAVAEMLTSDQLRERRVEIGRAMVRRNAGEKLAARLEAVLYSAASP
jgi:polysaccharide biosynthesis protein PslH